MNSYSRSPAPAELESLARTVAADAFASGKCSRKGASESGMPKAVDLNSPFGSQVRAC